MSISKIDFCRENIQRTVTRDDDSRSSDPVRHACFEARETIDQQIEKIHREDEKAIRMARVNFIVIGILTSSLSFIVQNSDIVAKHFVNAHNVVGLFFMLFSTLIAGMTYTSSTFEMGIGKKGIKEADGCDNGDYFLNFPNSTSIG